MNTENNNPSSVNSLVFEEIKICKVKGLDFIENNHSGRVAGTEPTEGQAFLAKTTIFEQSDATAKIAKLNDGTNNALISLPQTNFKFNQLFKDFECEFLDVFLFDEIKIHYEHKEGKELDYITFSGKLKMEQEPLISIKNFLKITDNLSLVGKIGVAGQNLSQLIKPQSFILETSASFYLPIFEGVTFTKGKVQLEAYQNIDMIRMKNNWKLGVGLWGTLEITNLHTKNPVLLDTHISYANGTLRASAYTENVENIFGIEGLVIDELQANFAVGKEMEMELTAAWHSSIGSMAMGGKLTSDYGALYGIAEDFSLESLIVLFNEITGKELGKPDFEVLFNKVMIGVASKDATVGSVSLEKGLTLQCDVKVHEYTCKVQGHISNEGFSFIGSLENITFESITIQEAKLHLQFYTSTSGKPCEVAIMGKANIQGVDVICKLAFEKLEGKWNIVAYGALEAKSFGMSNLFPATKDTFVDSIKFSKSAFIAATQDCNTQDPDYQFSIRKGLQLMARLEEIPGLSNLTNNTQIGLELTAYFGTSVDITISMPDTKLSLGENVVCSPFKIIVTLLPKPALELVFGLDLLHINPNPLHFDLALGMDLMGVKGSGTLKGWVVEPFGVKGLKIGPELAIQLGIDYAQFASTGTPSQFGFVGGMAIGEVVAKMAMNISTEPSRLILLGEIEKLTPKNLAKGLEDMFQINIPENNLPNFFELHELKLYCAPAGGKIGTITFEPGFSFSGNITFFNKNAFLYASLSKSGLKAKGHIDRLELGALTIRGKKGSNLDFDMALTLEKQSIFMDAAIDLFNSEISIFADISSKGVLFDFDLNFVDLLKVKVKAESVGSLNDFANLDFKLFALFNDELTNYIKNDLSKRIREASQATSRQIEDYIKEVERTEQAFKADMDKAIADLQKAEKEANQYLSELQSKVNQLSQEYQSKLNNLRNDLEIARNTYNNALRSAEEKVTEAQRAYDYALRSAEEKVIEAQRVYEEALNHAIREVQRTQDDYNREFGRVQQDLQSAINTVNQIQGEIDATQNELNNLQWWEGGKALYLGPKIATLWLTHKVAVGTLEAAKWAVGAIRDSTSFIASETAKAALEVARTGGNYVALETARKTLEIVRTTGDYAVLESAKSALNIVLQGSEYIIWQNASKALNDFEAIGRETLSLAEKELGNIGGSAIYIAFETAKTAVEATKNGASAVAFQTAKDALEATKHGSEAMLKVAAYITSHAGDIIYIKHVEFEASLSEIKQGKFFRTKLNMEIFSKPYHIDTELNILDVKTFFSNIFSQSLEKAKQLAAL